MFKQQADDAASQARRVFVAGLLTVIAFALITVARPAPANANIAYPYEFMPYIDNYQGYQGQSTCNPAPKPGVLDFRDYLNFWFGYHTSYISRDCSSGGQSEHKEGRALDYMLPSTDPTSLRILANVLSSDQYGNAHALGRRFGLMYIISNRKMFRFYRPQDGWQPYDGPNPHTDHIHFSFSWAGALRGTSWWTTTEDLHTGCQSRVRAWHFNSGFGPLTQIKAIRDGYGNLYDNQWEIAASPWKVEVGGKTYPANQPVSPLLGQPVAKVPAFVPGGWCRVAL